MSSTGSSSSTTSGVMEQAKYWMWMKSKLMVTEKPPSSPSPYVDHHHYHYNFTTTTTSTDKLSNWEEQAFAEDSAGPLGGFIWPPRYYSCTFCGREFRSAQALGGHMNVHRRDRAKLKESTSPPTPTTSSSPEHDQTLVQQQQHHDHQVCKVVYNSYHNSVLSVPKICKDDQKLQQDGSHLSLDLPCSSDSSAAVRVHSSSTHNVSHYSKLKNSSSHEIGLDQGDMKESIGKPGSAVSFCSSLLDQPKGRLDSTNHEEVYMKSSKRRRQDRHVSLLPLSLKPGVVVDQCRHFHKVSAAGLISSSMEELDLELRLGDRPNKVT